jgi:hypothetical protein
MSLNIEAVWSRPLELKLVNSGAIYRCGEIESIPYEPGCYIFGRAYDDYAAPLYIGKALMLRRRIEQQLDSVRLMTGIREAQKGGRFVIYCTPLLKRGQRAVKVISILEQALIAHAMSEDFELLQKQGTKTPNHTISFQGNHTSLELAPKNMRVPLARWASFFR